MFFFEIDYLFPIFSLTIFIIHFFLVITIFSNFEGSPLRYIWIFWEEMLNIGLRVQRLSLSEPHDALGNSRAASGSF